jgi:predicted small metal-binding protein
MERSSTVAKKIQCDCGFVAREEDDDTLVEVVQEHARDVHDMELTREQVLAMAKPD